MKLPCGICGNPTVPFAYRCYCCSSCQMFFRRNFELWPVVECRFDGKCDLRNAPNRRKCRACRLGACRALGLRMDGKSLRVRKTDGLSDGGSPPEHTVDSLPFLQRAVAAFGRLLEGEGFAASIRLPNGAESPKSEPKLEPLTILGPTIPAEPIFEPNCEKNEQQTRCCSNFSIISDATIQSGHSPPIPQSSTEFRSLEAATLRLVAAGISSWLQNISDLPADAKRSIIKTTVLPISLVNKFHMTYQRFPQPKDSRLAITAGHHVDGENFAEFLLNLSREESIRSRPFVQPLLAICVDTSDKFRRLQPTAIESAALMALLVCDKMERAKIHPEGAAKLRDDLCSQYFTHLSNRYSRDSAVVRLARLSGLVDDIGAVVNTYAEMCLLLGVFVPKYRDDHLPRSLFFPEAMISEFVDGLKT